MPESPYATDPAYAAILAHLAALHAPRGEAERHWVEELAFAIYRQRRLRALEDAAFAAVEAAGINEPEAGPCLRSLAALARYRARVERDLRLALTELDHLRLLAALAEEREAAWAAPDTDEPEPPATPARRERRTNEPEPRASRPNEPGPTAIAPRPLNRQERRRAAALHREHARRAA